MPRGAPQRVPRPSPDGTTPAFPPASSATCSCLPIAPGPTTPPRRDPCAHVSLRLPPLCTSYRRDLLSHRTRQFQLISVSGLMVRECRLSSGNHIGSG